MKSIAIPDKIEKKLNSISNDIGISKKDILLNALTHYLQKIQRKTTLKEELDLWENASDEDLAAFEKSL